MPSPKDRTSATKASPSTFTLVSFSSWPLIMMAATPAMYPTSTGFDNRSVRNPSRAAHATRQISATTTARPVASTA